MEELLFRALEALDADGPAGVERLLAAHPAAAPQVRAHLERLHAVGLTTGAQSGASTSERQPERLGGYRIVAPLGHGGMGVVYRAVQESLGREVALKLIRPDQLFFPGARERFRREVELVARMHHPGIVPIHEVGEDAGIPFFSMELVRGASVADVLARCEGRSPRELAGIDFDRAIAQCIGDAEEREPAELFRGTWTTVVLRIVREVAEALEHAHRRGVVHRDVKPSNVMITRDGRVLLLDFGLSGDGQAERLTRTGATLGSLAYMPPELLGGAVAATTSRSTAHDVYGLGASCWEMLALRLPYQATDPVQMHRLAAAASRPKLGECGADVPWDVETVVATALEPDPTRRYDSAQAFARDVDNLLAHRPIAAREAGAMLRVRRWSQRHPARATTIVAALLAVIAVPSLWAWQEARAAATLADANTKLERTNAELAAASRLAAAESARAKANFEKLQQAVDTMLTRVGERSLRDVPRMETVRRDLLQEALRFYETFVAEQADDPKLRAETGRIRARIGDVQGLLGDYAAAGAAFRQAIVDVEAATDRGHPINLAELHTRLAKAARLHGDLATAQSAITTALAKWDEVARGSDDVKVATGLADARIEASYVAVDRGAPADGFAVLEDSVRDLERWRAKGIASPQLSFAEARTLDRLGVALYQRSAARGGAAFAEGLERCTTLHERAATLCERLLADTPVDVEIRQLAAEIGVNRALAWHARREPERARRCAEDAIAVFEALAAEFPAAPHRSTALANALTNLAAIAVACGDVPAADRALVRALAIDERLLAASPNDEVLDGYVHAAATRAELTFRTEDAALALPQLDIAIAASERALAARPQGVQQRFVRRHLAKIEAQAAIAAGEFERAARAARSLLEERLAPTSPTLAAALLVACAAAEVAEERTVDANAHRREARELLVAVHAAGGDPFALRKDPTATDLCTEGFLALCTEVAQAK